MGEIPKLLLCNNSLPHTHIGAGYPNPSFTSFTFYSFVWPFFPIAVLNSCHLLVNYNWKYSDCMDCPSVVTPRSHALLKDTMVRKQECDLIFSRTPSLGMKLAFLMLAAITSNFIKGKHFLNIRFSQAIFSILEMGFHTYLFTDLN